MFSKWYGILWKSRSLEFYQINEMFNRSARDSSTRIQRQIYPVSTATTRHSISANRIFLFFLLFFLKRTSHKSGFHHWWSTVKLCWCAWRSNGANPALQQYWGAPSHFLETHLRSVLGFPPHERSNPFFFCWITTGDWCFTIFPLEWRVLIFLPTLCFKTQAKPSLLRPAQEFRFEVWGTGDYPKKTFPGRQVLPATSARSCLDYSRWAPLPTWSLQSDGVSTNGPLSAVPLPSAVMALVLAALPQLSLQFRAPLCSVGQPGVGTCRSQVPDLGCAVTAEWWTHRLPGGEEMKGWTVFTKGWGCPHSC